MSTTQPESGHEPPDLSELSATDALLDRLGRREPGDDDLRDPAVAALAELLAFVDESREPDLGMSRLAEVLAGRPLYVTAPDEAADSAATEPARVGVLGTVGSASVRPRVIDLTDRGLAAGSSVDDLDEPDDAVAFGEFDERDDDRPGVAASVAAGPVVAPVRAASGKVASVRPPVRIGSRRWQRTLAQVAMPAASVILLLVISGTVSAAITGNPLSPVNGVGRAVAQLPGVDDAESGSDKVDHEIRAATIAFEQNNIPMAQQHLMAAKRELAKVPDDQKTALQARIIAVQNTIGLTTPITQIPPIGVTTAPVTPGGGIPAGPTASPTTPVVTPTTRPPDTPTPTTTTPTPSKDPTTDVSPSTSESSPASTPEVSTAAVDPSSAATAAGPDVAAS